MIGVSFQPGSQDYGQQNGNAKPSSGSGVQEAIKILSLRLPRVLGAQSAASLPLLTSQGSGGNPRVDSIVNQILSRVLPGQQPPIPMQPSMASGGGPNFSGGIAPRYDNPQQPQQSPWTPPPGFRPRVIIGGPTPPRWPGQSGTDADLSGGGGQPPGMFDPLPNIPIPQQPPSPVPDFHDILSRAYNPPNYGSGGDSPFDAPFMF